MDNITSALGRCENPILASLPPPAPLILTLLGSSLFLRSPAFIRHGLSPATKDIESPSGKNTESLCLRGFITPECFRWKSETKRSVTSEVKVVDGARVSGWNTRFNSATHCALQNPGHAPISYVDRPFLLPRDRCNPEKETHESTPSMIASWETMRFLITSFNDNPRRRRSIEVE